MIHTAADSPTGAGPRRVLILNWRDIAHPRAGGAEKVTYEIARRWVRRGCHVTLFSAAYHGAQAEEMMDGVRVIRRGRQQTVHWEAYRYYRQHCHGRYDVIVDEVNTIPFFTPLYVREPVIMYCNQLAREVWRYEAPFPLSIVGYAAEPLYLQTYRSTPIMTISHSTETDLRRLGLRGPYHVIPMSVDTKASALLPSVDTKEPQLTLIFVGRVVPSKRVDHVIDALRLIHQGGAMTARLWIVGSWDTTYRQVLDRRIAAASLQDYVTFFGAVDGSTKEALLARAHVVVMTSVREGWGLVVTEANALGTPAVVYDVPGLRDSTRDGETGLICKPDTPDALARAVMLLDANRELYLRLRTGAWASAKELSWDRTARDAWAAMASCL